MREKKDITKVHQFTFDELRTFANELSLKLDVSENGVFYTTPITPIHEEPNNTFKTLKGVTEFLWCIHYGNEFRKEHYEESKLKCA